MYKLIEKPTRRVKASFAIPGDHGAGPNQGFVLVEFKKTGGIPGAESLSQAEIDRAFAARQNVTDGEKPDVANDSFLRHRINRARDYIVSWEGLGDANGEAVPFSADQFEYLEIHFPEIVRAIVKTFEEEILNGGDDTKNS